MSTYLDDAVVFLTAIPLRVHSTAASLGPAIIAYIPVPLVTDL